MDNQYQVLQVLYDIVKSDAHPLQYNVSIRELLLRLKGNWQSEYLEALAREQLVIVKKSETVVVQITEKGLEKAQRISVRL